MTITNGYVTEDQLRGWNNATAATASTNLERAIEAASRAIDDHCLRHFWQDGTSLAPKARRFAASSDTRMLTLGDFNDLTDEVVPVVRVDQDGDGAFETTWATSDFELLPLNPAAAPEPRPYTMLRSIGARSFPTATCDDVTGRIEVTGVWGWPAVPAAVTQACLLLAARLFIRKESPQGVAGWGDFGQIRVRNSDPDVTSLLEPYRRVAVLVA